MKIVPETLRRLRKESGLSQQGLADRARVDKKTVARIEGGKGGEARQGTALDIAKALRVEPKVLAEQPTSEAMEDRELRRHGYVGAKMHLHGETILAYDLVQDRYGVDMWDVIDAAPFLFTLLAEMSLADRRRRHKEMNEAWAAYWTTVPKHLRASIADHEAGSQVEDELIEKRDLFGRHIPEMYDWWAQNRDHDKALNPFFDFLSELVKALGPGNDAIDYDVVLSFGGDLSSERLFEAYRELLTGGSPRADYALSRGYVRLGQIPKHLRGEDEDNAQVVVERTKWLESHVPDEDWAERRRPRRLRLEGSEQNKGDENV